MNDLELSLDNIEDATIGESDDVENISLGDLLSDNSDDTEDDKDDPSNKGEDEPEESDDTNDSDDDKEDDEANPDSNIYQLAVALKEEGILGDDDDISDVDSPEAFRSLLENHIQKKLSDRHQRIEQALNSKMPTDVIKNFETTLNYLCSITSDRIKDESNEGEKLRKQLIFQDYINRGFSEEKARREVKKSFDAGTDLEDAMEAWQANYDYFKNSYDNEINKRNDEIKKAEEESKVRIEKFKKSLIEDKDAFGGIDVDKNTRQKIFNLIYNPNTTSNDGRKVSEMTRYFQEHPTDVYKYMAFFYDATDKFTNFNKLFKKQVNMEMKKGLTKLEETINGSSRTASGSLNLSNGRSGKTEGTLFNNNWDIDL